MLDMFWTIFFAVVLAFVFWRFVVFLVGAAIFAVVAVAALIFSVISAPFRR